MLASKERKKESMLKNFHFGNDTQKSLYQTMIAWSETPKLALKQTLNVKSPTKNSTSFSIGDKRDSIKLSSQTKNAFAS